MLKHTKVAFQAGVQSSARLCLSSDFDVIVTLSSGRKSTMKKALNHAVYGSLHIDVTGMLLLHSNCSIY